MARKSMQKTLGKERAPRVQIEYDVENYGAEKGIALPFVMGVMANLSGNPEKPLPEVGNRKFLEFDVDNFDDRMAAIKPRVTTRVKNKLTPDGGELPVELVFQSMRDFEPDRIAAQVPGLKELLEMRTQLATLLSYMDGKPATEKLISQFMQNNELQQAMEAAAKAAAEEAEAKEASEAQAENAE